VEQRIADIDFNALTTGRTFFPSPAAWEDEVLYFLSSVVPWSRIFNEREVLLAVNTDFDAPRTAWVTIDAGLHAVGSHLTCMYSTDHTQIGRMFNIEERNGRAVKVTLAPAGFAIYG
jgi:hypothetical protein